MKAHKIKLLTCLILAVPSCSVLPPCKTHVLKARFAELRIGSIKALSHYIALQP